MTPEQQAAFISAQAACALIEMHAMNAANVECVFDPDRALKPKYTEADFMALIRKYGIDHNSVMVLFG